MTHLWVWGVLVISAVSWDQEVPFRLETTAEWESPLGLELRNGNMEVDRGMRSKKNNYEKKFWDQRNYTEWCH